MKIYYSDHHPVPLPERHAFPEGKYQRLRTRLTASSLARAFELAPADPATVEDLELAHSPEYVQRVARGDLDPAAQRRLGLPWSPELYIRAIHSVGGTINACRNALSDRIAVNLGGGTHHAFRNAGAGFCVFNDAVVAGRVVLGEGSVDRIVVLDCDVHQGDGTAELVRDDPEIFAFSIHGARNFPFRKRTSDLDVALPNGASDEEYLEALRPGVLEAVDTSDPGLAIYLAGADPFIGDRFGRLAVSKQALAERDAFVLELCHRREIPVAVVMGGGYAAVDDVVDIHLKTVEIATRIFAR
jgi:acetoin utilization deacetylase AcuC-like enzyme